MRPFKYVFIRFLFKLPTFANSVIFLTRTMLKTHNNMN